MKILLIEPPFYYFQNVRPTASLGLAMLAAMAGKEGHTVQVFSPDLEFTTDGENEKVITGFKDVSSKMDRIKKRLGNIIHSFQPELFGISLWTARFDAGLELTRYIKEMSPDLPIIAGGIHATILPEPVLRSGLFDYVIRGEGEVAFASLLACIESGKDPKKEEIICLSYLNEKSEVVNNPIEYCQNLDELPFPGYEYFINHERFNKNVFQPIMFSRGCPFRCSFCASHKIWTRHSRHHSPAYIVRMIKRSHQRFGTKYFRFDDDTFTLKKAPVLEICRRLKQERMNIKWGCDTRVELVTPELLEEMKAAGADSIQMGVESGDTDVRKMINKTSSLRKTREAFKIAEKAGINTVGYFMIGFPGETYEQATRTLDLIEEIRPTIPCISICIPYPGTESYDKAVDMGLIPDPSKLDWSQCYHHSNINFSGKIDSDEWEDLIDRCKRIEESLKLRRIKNITIKKIVNRYTSRPELIIPDLSQIIRFAREGINKIMS